MIVGSISLRGSNRSSRFRACHLSVYVRSERSAKGERESTIKFRNSVAAEDVDSIPRHPALGSGVSFGLFNLLRRLPDISFKLVGI